MEKTIQPKWPKVLVLGHGRHGKDTFAELLCEQFGWTAASSSLACAKAIYPVLKASRGYHSVEDAYDDRHKHRELWKECISLLNYTDKTATTKVVLSQSNIYVGMRTQEQYEASKDMFDMIFWVDAFNRVHQADPTMEIKYNMKDMLWVDNNGSEEELRQLVSIISWSINNRLDNNGTTRV